MEIIKYYIKNSISFLLRLFWVFPIQKNKIFMMNDHSYTFSDNLKYLSLYLLENEPKKYDIYFSLKDNSDITDYDITPVKWLSFMHFYHSMTSSIIITNNGGISYLPIRKQQLVINTWHGGGPYKVTGTKALNDYYNMNTTEIDSKSSKEERKNRRIVYWYEMNLRYNAQKVNYILSSCKMCTDAEAKGLFYTDEQCLNIGSPRLDWMSRFEKVTCVRNKVFEKYGISNDKKLILYAPTFRGFFKDYAGVISDEMLEIDYLRTIKAVTEKFGGEWVFAVRLHPRLKDAKIKSCGLINMTTYPDAQELLMALDLLITDYSSVMWDVSFSKNPVFLFATDINKYQVRRGFYLPVEDWPFPLSTNNEELVENIRNFDAGLYRTKVQNHHFAVGSFEKGNACQTVREIIDNHIIR